MYSIVMYTPWVLASTRRGIGYSNKSEFHCSAARMCQARSKLDHTL